MALTFFQANDDIKYYGYHDEMEVEAPPSAPDWVKKAWVPAHKAKLYSPFFDTPQTVINANGPNNHIEFVGGPMAGEVHAHDPAAYPSDVIEGSWGISGTYKLEKHSWSIGTYRYVRKVYVFHPGPPPLKLKKLASLKKSPMPLKEYHVSQGFTPYMEAKSIDIEHNADADLNPDFKEYSKPVFSNGTHTGKMTFDLKNVSVEALKLVYGESADLSQWETPEEDDEPALWEQI